MSGFERADVLPREVADRMVEVLPERGEKVFTCLWTAAEFLRCAVEDDRGLRYPDSACYNVREALDAVVHDSEAAQDGLPSALRAWDRYQETEGLSAEERDGAWRLLEVEMDQLKQRRYSATRRDSQLIGFLRARTGIEALPGDLDPVVEYSKLRAAAGGAVHGNSALGDASSLFDRAVTWFVRMFTPPESIAQQLRELASERYDGSAQIERLRGIVSNPHHLRLFFGTVTDPGWLPALLGYDVIKLPRTGVPWPALGFVDGIGQHHPADVVRVLEDLFTKVAQLSKAQRAEVAFELLRAAMRLGEHAHALVGLIASKHRTSRHIDVLAVDVVNSADADHDVVEQITQAVLVANEDPGDYYRNGVLLRQMAAGITADNAHRRIRMLAGKLASSIALGDHPMPLDPARLTAELDERPRPQESLAHYLALMVLRARRLGVPTRDLLEWIQRVPGDAGERLASCLLARVDDVELEDKIAHVSRRLTSALTGDECDLVKSVLASGADSVARAEWATTFGVPSAAPGAHMRLPDDWIRAWQWSTVLPAVALAGSEFVKVVESSGC